VKKYWGWSRGLDNPRYFNSNSHKTGYWALQSPAKYSSGPRSIKQIALLIIAVLLTVSGVAASVAITIRGNNSTQDGVVSLGVGKAVATSCDTTTTIKTDTTSQYDDTYTDFILQRLDVYNVDPTCGGKDLNLVVNISGGSDVNVTCHLPASNSFSGWTTSQYTQASFIFTTAAFTTTAIGQTTCNSGGYIGYPVYMASIASTLVQIK
jgi:hypothetical protein